MIRENGLGSVPVSGDTYIHDADMSQKRGEATLTTCTSCPGAALWRARTVALTVIQRYHFDENSTFRLLIGYTLKFS